jgi:acyl-CoA synthetase (NDP forming)
MVAGFLADTPEGAAAAAARFGAPVALKADVPGLVRTSDAGTFLVNLHGPDEVRRGFRLLRETFGRRLADVIVQPVITGGVEVIISVLQEQVLGPLVVFGIGGAAADVLADRAARLAPLTDSATHDPRPARPGSGPSLSLLVLAQADKALGGGRLPGAATEPGR